MKTILLTLLLQGLATLGFTQATSASAKVSPAEESRSEESAIKKLVEDEVKYHEAKDIGKWLNCYAQSEDLTFGFLPGMLRGYNQLEKALKDHVAKNPKATSGTSEFTDYRIRQQGNTAFVSCIQTVTLADGGKQRYNKAEYLEKINGEWKIMGNLFGQEPVN